MKQIIDAVLADLLAAGNYRKIPSEKSFRGSVDLSSNDYLGIAGRQDLREEFLDGVRVGDLLMSASASRLLARHQSSFDAFESSLESAYDGRRALLFNSGYHANAGLISALAVKGTMVVADKLVHASIIDGIKLSGAPFERFRHNDLHHLNLLVNKARNMGLRPLIVAESVYSMDGDRADIDGLIEAKKRADGAMLYVDEAHAVGVEGRAGLGLSMSSSAPEEVDCIVGTLGKALGSVGAFVMTSEAVRNYAVNRSRSFIFSTALPPINVEWSRFIFEKSLTMDSERAHLKAIAKRLADGIASLGYPSTASHIQAFMVGNPHKAVLLSEALKGRGFDALPIRTPTVPAGTERLRLSLSAALTAENIDAFLSALSDILVNEKVSENG